MPVPGKHSTQTACASVRTAAPRTAPSFQTAALASTQAPLAPGPNSPCYVTALPAAVVPAQTPTLCTQSSRPGPAIWLSLRRRRRMQPSKWSWATAPATRRRSTQAGGAGRAAVSVRLLPLLLVCKRCALRGRHAHHSMCTTHPAHCRLCPPSLCTQATTWRCPPAARSQCLMAGRGASRRAWQPRRTTSSMWSASTTKFCAGAPAARAASRLATR